MSMTDQYNVGNYVKGTAAVAPVTTPSSSGVALTGITIDRLAFGRLYDSCKAVLTGHLAGSTQQVATVAMAFQHSSDGTSWDSYSTGTNASKAFGSTGATGAQSIDDVAEQKVNLRAARRYIKCVPTVSFGLTTSGDTFAAAAVLVLGGADELPATS